MIAKRSLAAILHWPMKTTGFLRLLILALFLAPRGFSDQFDHAVGFVTLTTRAARVRADLPATFGNLSREESQRLRTWSKIVAAAPKPLIAEQRPLAEEFRVRYEKIRAR